MCSYFLPLFKAFEIQSFKNSVVVMSKPFATFYIWFSSFGHNSVLMYYQTGTATL
jgi:hypothetical protein